MDCIDWNLLVAVVACMGTCVGAFYTYKASKNVAIIVARPDVKEYENLLKQSKYKEAFELLIDYSKMDSSFYEKAKKIHFLYFGLGFGSKDDYNKKTATELIDKIKKTKLNKNQKAELKRLIERVFLSDGTGEISELS